MLCPHSTVTENEPLDAWDEEETILTPDGDNEDEVCSFRKSFKLLT